MRRSRSFAAVAAIVLATVLAGCSGVPTNSNPDVIGPVVGGVAPSAASVVTPAAGADQRQIVLGFLQQNVSEDAHHTSARNYLTADASKKWIDTTTLVVNNVPLTGVPNLQTNTVNVTANKVGTVDDRGIYTPVTEGNGSTPINLTFELIQVAGQWRINALQSVLIVDQAAFAQTYRQRPIYFFDGSQRRLLSDLRYSPLTDQSLCSWLLEQLAAGPRAQLQSAFTSDLPEQTARAAVVFGQSIAVDLPGAAQLDGPTRSRLAAQLAYTFNLDFSAKVTLTDAGKPVSIPSISQPFVYSMLSLYAPTPPQAAVYYVRDGVVVSDGNAKPGGQAPTTSGLNTIAVAQRGGAFTLAATKGKADQAQLLVGPLNGTLTVSSVPAGPLTRPAWAVGASEVWVGDGSTLLRIPSVGAAAVPVVLASSAGAVAGQIRSVAFSPDGVRVALILKKDDGSSQLWIGTIVRTADRASVESLVAITPTGLNLTDVSWNDASTLYTIGSNSANPGAYGIWSVQLDGSSLTARSISGLPSAPDTITASQFGLPWVSANNTVWVQGLGEASSWTAPGGTSGTVIGTAPSYLQ